jgi:hypothetical protein
VARLQTWNEPCSADGVEWHPTLINCRKHVLGKFVTQLFYLACMESTCSVEYFITLQCYVIHLRICLRFVCRYRDPFICFVRTLCPIHILTTRATWHFSLRMRPPPLNPPPRFGDQDPAVTCVIPVQSSAWLLNETGKALSPSGYTILIPCCAYSYSRGELWVKTPELSGNFLVLSKPEGSLPWHCILD